MPNKKADFIIFTDGGSRGNPGPAAYGFVIKDAHGKLMKQQGEYIGETTNNDAEYQGVIESFKKLKSLIGKNKLKTAIVDVFLDSQLIERQMNGLYKISNEITAKHFISVHNLKVEFKEVRFTHIPREKNQEADHMVNVALDKHSDRLV